MTARNDNGATIRLAQRFRLEGLVQGQGVRPNVARIAQQMGLCGSVRNVMQGVEVTAVGSAKDLTRFQQRLGREFDATIVADGVEAADVDPTCGFRILDSVRGDTVQTCVPLDLVVCDQCLSDVRQRGSRRYQYPFTSCTKCGPRYSIIREMPFDRARTSMVEFPMCERCKQEYSDDSNRRFHAQTNACPDCGPKCWCTGADGVTVAGSSEAIPLVVEAIRAGQIVALQGIGGYQLVCDATNDAAIKRLRDRKGRPTKPLPVMVANLESAHQFAILDFLESETLRSSAGPIVLLRSRDNPSLSVLVHPGLGDVGLMLPTTPMHWLICDRLGAPLVVTSGNLHGAPIIYEYDNAIDQLGRIADVWLHHDRPIRRPVDDSVVRCVNGKCVTIRAGRGIAPLTIASNRRQPVNSQPAGSQPTIALGGHQKVALALSAREQFVLGPHIGDMETEESRKRLHDQQNQLGQLYRLTPRNVVHDMHPDYFTTSQALAGDRPTNSVQHHHAHITAAMLEHGLEGEKVLGFAFDGTGYGPDGTIWGGEVLLATATSFDRVAHLKPFTLPGGDACIREPWRTCLSLLDQAGDQSLCDRWLSRFDEAPQDINLQYAIRSGIQTTSMGRLFDAVATMVLSTRSSHYEGEPAMMLEAACDRRVAAQYEFDLIDGDPIVLDWRSLVQRIGADVDRLPPGAIAMMFHRAVAAAVIKVAERFRKYPAVLSGGVFQNRMLLELIQELATCKQLSIRSPGRIPTNDGGLSIGQLVVSAGKNTRSETGLLHEDQEQCV